MLICYNKDNKEIQAYWGPCRQISVVGFDISKTRVTELMSGHDGTLEVEDDVLQRVLLIHYPRTVRNRPPNGLL